MNAEVPPELMVTPSRLLNLAPRHVELYLDPEGPRSTSEEVAGRVWAAVLISYMFAARSWMAGYCWCSGSTTTWPRGSLT